MKNHLFSKAMALLLVVVMFLSQPMPLYAQVSPTLPAPGQMVHLSKPFNPIILSGMTINPQNPLEFNFYLDTGDSALDISSQAFKFESNKLIKYFLASLTVPEEDMWVNLSPYEENRIIPNSFGQTEMGRDLLAQDYILKQLTSSLMYPEKELGQKFWNNVYRQAQEQLGTTDIPVDTFHKVWIVPDQAELYQHGNGVFTVNNHLAVKLDDKHDGISSDVIRNIILPAIEKEVNEGKHFANLRQIYSAMILATWYKRNLKKSLLNQVYTDSNKVPGLQATSYKLPANQIYQKYLQAFKQGVYNYIKEEQDPFTQESIPRKYFSGGALGYQGDLAIVAKPDAAMPSRLDAEAQVKLDQAMPADDTPMYAKAWDIGNNIFTTTMELQQFPDPKGVDRIRRGYKLVNGTWVLKDFVTEGSGGPLYVAHSLKDSTIIQAAREIFQPMIDALNIIFEPEGKKVQYFLNGDEQAHIMVRAMHEDINLVDEDRRDGFWRLQEGDVDQAQAFIQDVADRHHSVEIESLGYMIGGDGGLIEMFYDPTGNFWKIRNAISAKVEQVFEGKALGRAGAIVHMTVGRVLDIPYSDEPALRERQRRAVNAIVQHYAQTFHDEWGQRAGATVKVDGFTLFRDRRWNQVETTRLAEYTLSDKAMPAKKSILNDFSFRQRLEGVGYSEDQMNYLATNPRVRIDGENALLFDLIGQEAEAALRTIQQYFPPFREFDSEGERAPTVGFAEFLELQEKHRSGEVSVATNRRASQGLERDEVVEAPYFPNLVPEAEMSELYARGEEILKQGKVSVVVPAGGEGGRFGGYDLPPSDPRRQKVLAPILDVAGQKRSSLAVRAANILWWQQRGANIPLLVMGSNVNESILQTHIESSDYYGLNSSNVDVYAQYGIYRINPIEDDVGEVSLLEGNGEPGDIFRTNNGSVSLKPAGHVEMIAQLVVNRRLLRLAQQGVEVVVTANGDDTGFMIDPAKIGHFYQAERGMMASVVQKNDPKEKGGVPVRVNGQDVILEKLAFPSGFNSSSVPFFSTNQLYFKVEALLQAFNLTNLSEYEHMSQQELASRVRATLEQLPMYVEVKDVIVSPDGVQPVVKRKAAQFARLVGDLSRIIPAQYIRVNRQGEEGIGGYWALKTREDAEAASANLQAMIDRTQMFSFTDQAMPADISDEQRLPYLFQDAGVIQGDEYSDLARQTTDLLNPPVQNPATAEDLADLYDPNYIGGPFTNGMLRGKPTEQINIRYSLRLFERVLKSAKGKFVGNESAARERYSGLLRALWDFEPIPGQKYLDQFSTIYNDNMTLRLANFVLFGEVVHDSNESALEARARTANDIVLQAIEGEGSFNRELQGMRVSNSPVETAQHLQQAIKMSLYATSPNIRFSDPDVQGNIGESVSETQRLLSEASAQELVIDDTPVFVNEVLEGSPQKHITCFIDDNGDLGYHLRMMENYLLMNPNLSIAVVAKRGRYATDASYEDVMYELDNRPEYENLRTLRNEGRFSVLENGPELAGIDLRNISKELAQELQATDLVIVLGQSLVETINGLNKPLYLMSYVDGKNHRIVTGLPKGSMYFKRVKGGKYYDGYPADQDPEAETLTPMDKPLKDAPPFDHSILAEQAKKDLLNIAPYFPHLGDYKNSSEANGFVDQWVAGGGRFANERVSVVFYKGDNNKATVVGSLDRKLVNELKVRFLSVSVFVNTPNRQSYFMLRRPAFKNAEPKKLAPAGGYAEHGETAEQAALKELHQEFMFPEGFILDSTRLRRVKIRNADDLPDNLAPEFAVMYEYDPSPDDMESIGAAKEVLKAEKRTMTQEAYEELKRRQNKENPGSVDAYGIYIVPKNRVTEYGVFEVEDTFLREAGKAETIIVPGSEGFSLPVRWLVKEDDEKALPHQGFQIKYPDKGMRSITAPDTAIANAGAPTDLGGIDLNAANLDLIIQNASAYCDNTNEIPDQIRDDNLGCLEFNIPQAQVDELRSNIHGFVPVIINIQPVTNAFQLLGLNGANSTAVI